jgi:hypothetical protein
MAQSYAAVALLIKISPVPAYFPDPKTDLQTRGGSFLQCDSSIRHHVQNHDSSRVHGPCNRHNFWPQPFLLQSLQDGRTFRGGSAKPKPRMCMTASATVPWYTIVPEFMIITSSKSAYVSGGGCNKEMSIVFCRLWHIARIQRIVLKRVAASCRQNNNINACVGYPRLRARIQGHLAFELCDAWSSWNQER